ncbi:MAG: RNA polymerase sigma factor [Anaerolineae bacterium]
MIANATADAQALLEQLYTQHHHSIVNYLYRMVGDSGRAEELAQDVFLRAFRALPRLPSDANHRAWLYRIATNVAYDTLRRRRLVSWLALRETDRDEQATGGPDRLAEQQAVQMTLMQLPDGYRAVLVLFSVQGYSVREIAESMGISEGAVKTRLSRAREMFRKAYEHEA